VFDNVVPNPSVFFGMLTAHAERVVAGANATLRLVTSLGNPAAPRAELIEEVNVDENGADRIKEEFVRLLYESFTTPIDRDRAHALIMDLDRVLDRLQSVANAIRTYSIERSTPEARTMASLAADACLRLSRAVSALGQRSRNHEIFALCREIEEIEGRARDTMREAVTRLFRDEGDEAAAWHAVKMRRFYFSQESVLDGCKRAAHTVEEILIEHA
jgi:uncharacterized protein Yka (UPF0111/DUF47 family)